MENGQRVYPFLENTESALQRPPQSTLLSFFKLCQNDEFAKTLLYPQLQQYYTFNKATKEFLRRKKQGQPVGGFIGVFKAAALGRAYTIHPNNTKCYYMGMLLPVVLGPTSFNYLKTVKDVLYNTFQIACQRRGLLEDDNHWHQTLRDAMYIMLQKGYATYLRLY